MHMYTAHAVSTMGYSPHKQNGRTRPGAFRVAVNRFPRVLLRRGLRGLLIGLRHHARAALAMLGVVLIMVFVVMSRSPADNWDTLRYVTCMLGVRHLLFRRHTDINTYHGGLGINVNIYPLEKAWTDGSECLQLPTYPSPLICVHNVEVDRFISGAIKDGVVWEVETVALFQEILRGYPSLGVVDIGANIGQYSLLAASMGRHVMAVEPFIKHIRMIHKAAVLNNFHPNNFTLVQNAVSDSSRIVSLQFKKDNRGAIRIVESNFRIQKILKTAEENCNPSETSVETITMNDLVPHIHFKQTILKIDIEGHEVKAMLRSGIFLEKLYVPFVIMEWVFMRNANDEYKVKTVQELVDYMLGYNYEAFTTKKKGPLPYVKKFWMKWPQDIVWKLKSVEFPKYSDNSTKP